MNLTDDELLSAMRGRDSATGEQGKYLFKDICFIYPAILDDIQSVKFSIFMKYLGLIISGKPVLDDNESISEEMKQFISGISDFQFLLLRAVMSAVELEEIKLAFKFFIHEETTFIPDIGIVIGPIEEKRILREEDFGDFVQLIKVFHYFEGMDNVELLDSDTPHVRALKLKQLENKKRLAEAKQKKRGSGKNDDIQFSDLVSCLASNGNNGISLLNIWDLSYYGLQDQIRRMNLIEGYDMRTRAALAGAKIKKEDLEHWIQHLAPGSKN